VATRWPVNALAFHPTLPLLAVGSGAYDGGYFYDGELLLVNLLTGTTESVLNGPREVRRLSWRDEKTLDLVLAVRSDDDYGPGSTSVACFVRCDDWRGDPEEGDTIGVLQLGAERPHPDREETDPAVAVAVVERLCAEHGLVWQPRRAVWAVRGLADGRIVAASEGVALECWSPGSDECSWRVPTAGVGCQVSTSPDGRTALVLTQVPQVFRNGRWSLDPSVVVGVDLADGAVRGTHEVPFPAVLVNRADGWWAWRDTRYDSGSPTSDVTLAPPDAARPVTVQLSRYDLFNHYFDIRYAPELLFLHGTGDRPHRDKWVVAVDAPQGSVRPLFPLEWDASRGGHLFGGCGAYLDDGAGPAIVHSGSVHDGAGFLPGNAFVVRRAYPTGEPQWVYTAGNPATAIDVDAGLVFVALNSGELIVLRAADGAVRARQQLRLHGRRVIPLSLARVGADRLAIGTLDGRVLDCVVGDL
jgi:hypothetical protein